MTKKEHKQLAEIILNTECYIEFCQNKANETDPQNNEYQWYIGKIAGLDYAKKWLIAFNNQGKKSTK